MVCIIQPSKSSPRPDHTNEISEETGVDRQFSLARVGIAGVPNKILQVDPRLKAPTKPRWD
jgi:hypothetical protein